MLFKTLCALHNILIKAYGLDTNWMGVSQAQELDRTSRVQLPPMLLCLHAFYMENTSSHTRGNDGESLPDWKSMLSRRKHQFTINDHRIVRMMPQSLFVECLVEHFNIMYQKKEIVWPRRNNNEEQTHEEQQNNKV